MIDSPVPNANDPGLSIRILLKQSLGCRQNVLRDFKSSGFNIDRDNLAYVSRFDLLLNAGIIECLPTPS
jgi:hypothetical protein